jgi:hypothetical protein
MAKRFEMLKQRQMSLASNSMDKNRALTFQRDRDMSRNKRLTREYMQKSINKQKALESNNS